MTTKTTSLTPKMLTILGVVLIVSACVIYLFGMFYSQYVIYSLVNTEDLGQSSMSTVTARLNLAEFIVKISIYGAPVIALLGVVSMVIGHKKGRA